MLVKFTMGCVGPGGVDRRAGECVELEGRDLQAFMLRGQVVPVTEAEAAALSGEGAGGDDGPALSGEGGGADGAAPAGKAGKAAKPAGA
jgi:hypothetical protein